MRIRTIKPDFWQHEQMSVLPPFTRLLAIALLNYADDEGYFNCNPALIRGNLFPFQEDSKNILVGLQELSRATYLEVLVLEDGREIGKIINFRKHQRIDKPQKSKLQELVCNSKNVPRTFQESSKTVLGGNGMEQGSGKVKELPPSGVGQITFPTISDHEQKPKATNPEHGNFIARWCESFKKHHNGRDYIFNGGRDGKAVQRLLATGKSTDELIKIAIAAWAKPGIWECDKAVDIHGFAANINAIIEKVEYRPPAKVDVDSPEYRAAYEASLTPTV